MKPLPRPLALALAAAAVAVASLAASCAVQKAYWVEEQENVVKAKRPDAWAILPEERGLSRNLRIIEYDELGDRWESMQVRRAQRLIRERRDENFPVIVFIHGWKNNAYQENEDLRRFNKFITNYKNLSRRDQKGAIGIYIAWRGASFDPENELKELGHALANPTFWDRKAAADRVAGIP